MRVKPAFLVFVVLFVAAASIQLAYHNGVRPLIEAAALAIFCLLTRWLTVSDGILNTRKREHFLALQTLACAIIFVATLLFGISFNHVTPVIGGALGFANAHYAITSAMARYVPSDIANGIANFTLYCVPIAVALLLLGVPLSRQGLGRFKRGSLASAAVWLLPPVGAFAWAALTGHLPVRRILRSWLGNLLNNGVSEEFLWRGAIMGRLRALMGSEAALYLQAVLFGLWHFGTDYHIFSGNLALLFANMFLVQITFGLAVGYVTQRTGNIAIGSAFHMLSDSAQDLL